MAVRRAEEELEYEPVRGEGAEALDAPGDRRVEQTLSGRERTEMIGEQNGERGDEGEGELGHDAPWTRASQVEFSRTRRPPSTP